jgi:hypothetical protein
LKITKKYNLFVVTRGKKRERSPKKIINQTIFLLRTRKRGEKKEETGSNSFQKIKERKEKMETEKQTTEETKNDRQEAQDESALGKRKAVDDGDKPNEEAVAGDEKEPPKKRQARQPKKSKGGDETSKKSSASEGTQPNEGADEEKKKRHQKHKFIGFKLDIHRLISQRYPEISISEGALHVANAYAMDIQARLCERAEALLRANARQTIKTDAIIAATETMFTRKVSSILCESGTKAAQTFSSNL